MPQLSKSPIVERRVLERLGASRLKEARALLRAKCYAGAIYLAGYAVECYLKAAICATLDWDELRATFTSHDLELLLVHSGLERRIKTEIRVQDSFAMIQGTWMVTGKNAVRYRDPSDFQEADARAFLRWVAHKDYGVVPWVRKQI